MTVSEATARLPGNRIQPARIVSLLPAATEILCFLGLEEHLVGVSHQCRHLPQWAGKPCVTSSPLDSAAASGKIDADVRQRIARGEPLYEIDEPQLAALQPQLIVTQVQCDVCAVRYADVVSAAERIAREGTIEVLPLHPGNLADILQDILRVGQAAGVLALAKHRVHELEQRIGAIRDQTEPILAGERPRVVVIEWIEPLMVAANWTPELVALAGGDYALAESGVHSGYARWDDIRRYDPDVLLVAACGFDLARTVHEAGQLTQLPGWEQLSAVRHNRVWALDGDIHLNCPSPGVVATLELLAHLLHPQRFSPPTTCHSTWQRFAR